MVRKKLTYLRKFMPKKHETLEERADAATEANRNAGYMTDQELEEYRQDVIVVLDKINQGKFKPKKIAE